MPCIHHINSDNISLAVWRIGESENELLEDLYLNPEEFHFFLSINNLKRKLEWLAARHLLKVLFPDEYTSIHYDKKGKPFLTGKKEHISIAHSQEYVVVAHSTKKTVGVDIEKIGDRIEKIAHKYLSEEEAAYLYKKDIKSTIQSEVENRMLYIIWGAKECMFKIYSKGELDFKSNLHIDKFVLMQRGEIEARLIKKSVNKKYHFEYDIQEDWLMVYGTEI